MVRMGVHFYFGSSGSGKSRFLQMEIIRRSILEPSTQFIMLVPEQFTMQTQKEMVLRHPRRGLMNVDVLSFERLAYRVFDEVGMSSRRRLEEIGKSFVLEKIALDLGKKLPVLGANLARPGNLADMKSVISELMLYDIGPDDLLCGEAGAGSLLDGKLSDICAGKGLKRLRSSSGGCHSAGRIYRVHTGPDPSRAAACAGLIGTAYFCDG